MRRLLGVVLCVSFAIQPSAAHASCGYDPADISFKQMIRAGTTGDDYYHRMIIGRVADIRDPGAEGGEAIAAVAVGAHPTGSVPLVARVRIEEPSSILDSEPDFDIGERWVIIARQTTDGSYRHDGFCGRTSWVSRWRFRTLMALAEKYD